MVDKPLTILQINTKDQVGGAAQVAWDLHQSYLAQGHDAWLVVRSKFGDDPRTIVMPNWEAQPPLSRSLQPLGQGLGERPWARRLKINTAVNALARPRRTWNSFRGYEDFEYPGIWQLIERLPKKPDIIHCHNLHGDYFDLRALPRLSHLAPLVLTLHDAWLLSGHCSHSFGCRRWQSGCGHCPDLSIYPAIRRDATRANWRRKQTIFSQSLLHVAAPAQWLMNRLPLSMLEGQIMQRRLIRYGIDLSVFQPGDMRAVRANLDIPEEALVLLFAAEKPQSNRFKGFATLRRAVERVARDLHHRPILFLAMGGSGEAEKIGSAKLRFVPYVHDRQQAAKYFLAADLYLHAANADTFPVTVLEALACGTPVVGTAVGGISEQVKGTAKAQLLSSSPRMQKELGDLNFYSDGQATGILVHPGAAELMAAGIVMLLEDDNLRRRLAENAARDARQRFDLKRQCMDYLNWYRELVQAQESGKKKSGAF